MSEIENMGVDTVQMGTEQTQEVATSEKAAELPVKNSETSELGNEEIKPSTEEVDKQEIAFAKRLAKEREKFERDKQAEIARYKRLAELGAKENNLSLDEYLAQIEEQARENEKAALENLPEDVKRKIEYANMQERQSNELTELLDKYPDIKAPSDLPEGTLDLYNKYSTKGMSLLEAYEIMKPKIVERTKVEQEAIKKLQNNAKTSTGSLSQPAQQETKSVSKMSSTEFNEFVERVKRGEVRDL